MCFPGAPGAVVLVNTVELLHTAFAAAFPSAVSRSPFDSPPAGTAALVWQVLAANTNEGWFIHKIFLSEELDSNSALVLHCFNCPDGKEVAPQNVVDSSHVSPWGENFPPIFPCFWSQVGNCPAESITQLREAPRNEGFCQVEFGMSQTKGLLDTMSPKHSDLPCFRGATPSPAAGKFSAV